MFQRIARLGHLIGRYIGWPVVCGLLLALLYLQYKNTAHQSNEKAPYSYADAVQRAIPSVVNIYTRTVVRRNSPSTDDLFFHYPFNTSQQEKIQKSLGSGVIISEQGYLLTNYHVIAGADEIIVLLNDGRESMAKVIGADAEIDLAVLEINLPNLSPITTGDIDNARVGDVVLAIGNPYGVGKTVTQGIISASSHEGFRVATNYIQTDAAINPGNSGGALVDAEGKLLGINTMIISETGASIGIGLALPVDTAMKALHDIVHYGHVIRGALGIVPKPVPAMMARKFGINPGTGLLITAIYRNGPAHRAGLMPGDVIIQIDGHTVTGDEAGIDTIAKTIPGKETSILINRRGQVVTESITPGVRAD